MKTAIRLALLGLPFRKALAEASRLGAAGVQLDSFGEFMPRNLSDTGRRELRRLLKSHDLELTAMGCPLRRGLDNPEKLEARIEYVREVMDLSFELGSGIVIVEAGRLPEEPEMPGARFMHDSLQALGQHGDRMGGVLALETGLESGDQVDRYLAKFDSGGLGVNFDPGNLLINGFDPFASVSALRERIVHVHAHDARKSSASRSAAEVPLGHGDIDWMRFLDNLQEIEYQGWVTVDRNTGPVDRTELAQSIGLLRRLSA